MLQLFSLSFCDQFTQFSTTETVYFVCYENWKSALFNHRLYGLYGWKRSKETRRHNLPFCGVLFDSASISSYVALHTKKNELARILNDRLWFRGRNILALAHRDVINSVLAEVRTYIREFPYTLSLYTPAQFRNLSVPYCLYRRGLSSAACRNLKRPVYVRLIYSVVSNRLAYDSALDVFGWYPVWIMSLSSAPLSEVFRGLTYALCLLLSLCATGHSLAVLFLFLRNSLWRWNVTPCSPICRYQRYSKDSNLQSPSWGPQISYNPLM
jgi:hypothetical protein